MILNIILLVSLYCRLIFSGHRRDFLRRFICDKGRRMATDAPHEQYNNNLAACEDAADGPHFEIATFFPANRKYSGEKEKV